MEITAVADAEPRRPGMRVAQGATVSHRGKTYDVVQGHISQSDWPPDKGPALFNVRQKEPEGGGVLQRVAGETVKKQTNIQGHTTQAGWEPPAITALWQEVK